MYTIYDTGHINVLQGKEGIMSLNPAKYDSKVVTDLEKLENVREFCHFGIMEKLSKKQKH